MIDINLINNILNFETDSSKNKWVTAVQSWRNLSDLGMNILAQITSQGGPISLFLCSFERRRLSKEKEPNNGKLDWSGKEWTKNERIMKNEFFEFSHQNHWTSKTIFDPGGPHTYYFHCYHQICVTARQLTPTYFRSPCIHVQINGSFRVNINICK